MGRCDRPLVLLVVHVVENRITHPVVDGRLTPTGAARGDANLFGKRAGLDLPVERRAAEAGAIEHGVEAKNAVGRIGRHGIVLYRVSSNRSPSIHFETPNSLAQECQTSAKLMIVGIYSPVECARVHKGAAEGI